MSASQPPGVTAIYQTLKKIYPDQPNPLQVTALVKYWLNGPDPLDYVSMYANNGNPHLGIHPHWHYVSCGLSDLHGDGRVHSVGENDGPSGYGFELTFRLRRNPDETSPPTWPAQLMQELAKYVFNSDACLCDSDFFTWNAALDYQNDFIEQILIVNDPQLSSINAPFGYINFYQIVGICNDELHAVQQWNGHGIINLMKNMPETGGQWLVTDMERRTSLFQLNPRLKDYLEMGIEQEGSNLSAVSSKSWWSECSQETILSAASRAHNCNSNVNQPSSSSLSIRIRSSLANFRNENSDHHGDGREASRMSNYSSVSELLTSRPIKDGLQLRFNLDAAAFLPLAIKGRLAHGRHFTFQSKGFDSAITFVSSDITGTSVDETNPYAALKRWLQILIPDDFLELLAHDFDELQRPEELTLPRMYVWPHRKLMITVVGDGA